MSILNPEEFDADLLEMEGVEQPSVYEQLKNAEAEIKILNLSILILKQTLDKHGIPYFDSYRPLAKKPSEMTREELITRNKEASERIEKNKQASSPDAIPVASYDDSLECAVEQSVVYEPKGLFQLLKATQEHGGSLTAEQLAEAVGAKNGEKR